MFRAIFQISVIPSYKHKKVVVLVIFSIYTQKDVPFVYNYYRTNNLSPNKNLRKKIIKRHAV